MRYFLLLFASSLISITYGRSVIAATGVKTADAIARISVSEASILGLAIAQTSPSTNPNFWLEAQKVVQEQILLTNRIERALTGTDLKRAEAVREQLTLHLRTVERFLKSQYPRPDLLCRGGLTNGSTFVNPNLSEQQKQVYCALVDTSQQLASLQLVLDNRLPRLADLAGSRLLPSRTNERFNFREPAPSRLLPVPNLPLAEPPLIGTVAKTPIADYVPPFVPPASNPTLEATGIRYAIALPEQAAKTLPVVKRLLAPAIAAFPASTTFTYPEEDASALDRLSYGLNPKEPPLFAEFLAQPNTGIARILPAEAYRPNLNRTGNRLQPTVAERFPFAPLLSNTSEFTPRLAIRIENGNFEIAQPGLDYGFMVDVGEVPLEDLGADMQKTLQLPKSPQTRQFFRDYRPPKQLNAIQVDRQRFITGKLDNLPLIEPVLTQAPAILKHTYLLRLVQYKLPQVLLTNRTVSGRDRRNLDEIIQTPSSDLLVAFSPVIRRSDGSYTVLWRVLNQFPNPQIEDLENHLYLD